MKDTLMKDFLTKRQLRIFLNDRLNQAKVKRIVLFSKDGIIFTTDRLGNTAHNFSYGYIQSVSFITHQVTYVINYKEFKHILNEVDFFRRFPKDAEKRGVTVI